MTAIAGRREVELGDAEFDRIARILLDWAGISLPATKRSLVYARLTKRLRALGLDDFGSYIAHVEGADGAAERIEMISALTTNVTSFFRERHHFDILRDRVLSPALAAGRSGTRVRLWSAGCSSGEEPYTLAMTVLGIDPEAGKRDLRILATDIDPAILARARDGVYGREQMDAVAPEMRQRWFEPAADGTWRVAPALSGLVAFRELNLMEDWPVRGPFDAIFCRNVTIYFDRAGQEKVWKGFAERLAPGGLLCIGHSERLTGPAASRFRTAGITAYTLNS